ncbi:hypothetical protein BDY21DRAFT_364774 [Lineolata rhizophorae]|uniref:Uncharacterized protein n=1 Tax=Lineolata rhizophorae TaxID=578093 RepID=A0A6A6NWC8_9PEZI|nr:hypothetical protein BDY21DRAFT_364774 [Lineolata rhizophorae]
MTRTSRHSLATLSARKRRPKRPWRERNGNNRIEAMRERTRVLALEARKKRPYALELVQKKSVPLQDEDQLPILPLDNTEVTNENKDIAISTNADAVGLNHKGQQRMQDGTENETRASNSNSVHEFTTYNAIPGKMPEQQESTTAATTKGGTRLVNDNNDDATLFRKRETWPVIIGAWPEEED